MTDWKKYFNSTILSRGRQYYHEGRVKRLTHRDHEWFAAVKGSRSYNVIAQIGEDGDIEDMECSCLYAYNGQNCKHMAALLYAVEADQKENDVQTELELARQRMDKEDKVIFKKLAAQTEYNYFDLNMAAQKLELSKVYGRRPKDWQSKSRLSLMIFKRGIWAGTVIRSLFCMQRADILQKEMMVMRFRSFALRTVLNRHCVMSEDAEDLIRLPERDIERIVMAMFVSMRQRLCISWKII